ncbi:hypothetical protein RND81_13G208300 [Saponaria officinalis]|uniref:Transmembrane protein n=1 Tax=Saponaria officinalis TaxID=3572 RepID=A0AAW1H5P0_SAPOF
MAYTKPCKPFALVTIIILVFLISSPPILGARKLQEKESKETLCESDNGVMFSCENEDNNNNNNHGVIPSNYNEGLVVMDYSPVRQNTPIHHN